MAIEFGSFRIDLGGGLLLRAGEPIPLRPKTWSVLLHLAQHPGQLISKQELLDAVWGHVAVGEAVLSKSIGELRVALGDSFKKARLLETVHRRGFRFIAPVRDRSIENSGTAPNGPWQLARAAATDDRPPGIDEPPRPFIGRAEELRRLETLLASVRGGQREIVFVTGEAGIGKTALVEAFLDLPAVRQGPTPIRVARGFCLEQHGPPEPYMPVLNALGRLARGPHAAALGTLLRQVAPTWLAQMPWLIGEDEARGLLPSVQFVRPERMLREFAVLMETLAADTPLVLVLEDLHWSDPSSIDVLSMLGERDEKARLLVIGTYRPADDAVREHPMRSAMRTLLVRRRCTELALPDLSLESVHGYLLARFPGSSFPLGLARRIHQHTEGHPLFLVGVVDSLLSEGHILETAPGWALTLPPDKVDLAIPADVSLLIESQLDGLSPADRALLQAASVAGEDFSPLVVAAALGLEEADAEMRCEAFVRAGRFLRTAGHVEWPDHRLSRRYRFSHELYRRTVYAQITEGRCMRLHQRIGEALEVAYGARRLEIAPRLAGHFHRGRDDGRAVQYLTAAATAARRRFANREVIGYLEAALALLALGPDEARRRREELELRLALGPALVEAYGYASDQAFRNYERASELSAGSPSQHLRVLNARWYVHGARAERELAIAIATEFEGLARRRGTAQDRLLADFVMLRTSYFDGRFLEARRYWRRIAGRGRRQTVRNPLEYGPDPLLASMGHFALTLWFLGYPERAQKQADAAVAGARAKDHAFTLATVLYASSGTHLLCRNATRGRQLAEEAVSLSVEHGFPWWQTLASVLTGYARIQDGQAGEGCAVIERALDALAATGAKLHLGFFHVLLAEGRMSTGPAAHALAAVDAGLEVARTTLDRNFEPELWRLKGELLLRADGELRRTGTPPPTSNAREAERCFRRALALARASRAKSLELRGVISLARAWAKRGRAADARRLLGPVCRWFDSQAGGADLADARSLLGQLSGPKAGGRRSSKA